MSCSTCGFENPPDMNLCGECAAHRLFVEMGAAGHAERVNRQLAATSSLPKEQ